MKAILVIDEMPVSCDKCEVRCDGYTAKEYAEKGIKRPSWCPLKPMPKKFNDDVYEDWMFFEKGETEYNRKNVKQNGANHKNTVRR